MWFSIYLAAGLPGRYPRAVASSDPLAGRPLRRDAERNRQRILTAAADLIAEQGLSVSHDQIARAADVAVGTVYRRFPEKSSLVEALYRDQVEAVVASARAALDIADPWQALVTFMTQILQFQAGNRGLQELSSGAPDGLALATYARTHIAPVVTELLARAREAGAVRADVTEPDLALIPIMIGAIIHRARHIDPGLWRRTLAIVLDGLRPEHRSPLPGTALDSAQLARIISNL
jgi:AcrR family transcriptional regulator